MNHGNSKFKQMLNVADHGKIGRDTDHRGMPQQKARLRKRPGPVFTGPYEFHFDPKDQNL